MAPRKSSDVTRRQTVSLRDPGSVTSPLGSPRLARPSGSATSPVSNSTAFLSKSNAGGIDIRAFTEPSFSVDFYLDGVYAANNEESLRAFYANLIETRKGAARGVQRNVYKHYQEFVTISNEISQFEADMLQLRGMMNEIQSVIRSVFPEQEKQQLIRSSSQHSNQAAAPLANANSSPSLVKSTSQIRVDAAQEEERREWQQQIQENVEGVQRYLADPSRYIIYGADNVLEVRPSNMKAKPIFLYLFNDSLLVAVRARRGAATASRVGAPAPSSRYKWAAEKFIMLRDLIMENMEDADELYNAFMMTFNGQDRFYYQADSGEVKRSWMKRLQEAIQQAASSPSQTASQPRPNRSNSNVSKENVKLVDDAETSAFHRSLSLLDASPGEIMDETQFSLLSDLLDDLDVTIAQCEYDRAVSLTLKVTEQLERYAKSDQRCETLHVRHTQCRDQLAHFLRHEISNDHVTKSMAKLHVERLIQIGLADQARDLFLTCRSNQIRAKIKQVHSDGDVPTYIHELTFVVVSQIKLTADWFTFCFRDSKSALLLWAKQEFLNGLELVQKQVFNLQVTSFSQIAECVRACRFHAKSLRQIGMDFIFLMDKRLLTDLEASMDLHVRDCIDRLKSMIAREQFDYLPVRSGVASPVSPTSPDQELLSANISASAVHFYKMIIQFLNDLNAILSPQIYKKLIEKLSDLFECFGQSMLEASYRDNLEDRQFFNMITDVRFIARKFLKSVHEQLMQRFKRPIPECDALDKQLEVIRTTLQKLYWDQRSIALLREIRVDALDYTQEATLSDTAQPSEWAVKLVRKLNQISLDLDPTVNRQEMMKGLLDEWCKRFAVQFMTRSRCFGLGGAEQCCLDLIFLLEVCDTYLELGKTILQELMASVLSAAKAQRALRDARPQFKSELWLKKRLRDCMSSLGPEVNGFGGGL